MKFSNILCFFGIHDVVFSHHDKPPMPMFTYIKCTRCGAVWRDTATDDGQVRVK